MTCRVTELDIAGDGDRQRFQVTVERAQVIVTGEVPVTDLPADIRFALLKWLGAAG